MKNDFLITTEILISKSVKLSKILISNDVNIPCLMITTSQLFLRY